MKYLLTLFTFLLCIFFRVGAQEASYPVSNYTTKDYGKNFNPANMAIAQDQRGIIYAANGFKLLEFDGTNWNSYPINKGTWILSLAIDGSGIIYAGSQNEFGLFTPDKKGELQYHSLSDSLDIQDFEFSNIWKVHSFSGGIVFQAEERIFIYKDGKTEVIKPESSFHTSFVVNDILFVRQRGSGLMEWQNNRLVKIKGSEIFDTTGIFLMLPYGNDKKKILIGTQEKGFWLFDPESKSELFKRFRVDEPQLFEKSKITGGIITGDGSIAISTMLNGVIIIDTAGKLKAIINNKNGLADNDIKQLLLDQNRNLWIALNNGISRVEISSPLSVKTEKSGLTGNINTVKKYNNLLYVGTSTGLFVQKPGNEDESTFIPVSGLTEPVWSLTSAEGSLFAGTDEGLYQINNRNLMKIGNEASFSLFYSPKMKLLFSGGPKGLVTYKFDGSFRRINSISIEGQDIIGITNEANSADDDAEFWLGTRYNGVIRFKINKDFTFITDSYNYSDGLPDGWVVPYTFNSRTLFGSIRGLFEFTNENSVRASLPDSLKNNKAFSKGYFSQLSGDNESFKESVSFVSENNNKIWVCSDNSIGYLDKKDNMNWVSKPFMGIETGKINVIYPEESGICWIGTTDGLIRFDENTVKDYDSEFHSLLRKVTLLKNDSVIFMGTSYITDSGIIRITPDQPFDQIPSLTYRNNSVRFDFSAPFYEYSDKILYSCKLEGDNSKWSQWSKETFQEYTNLHEGSYTFIVKAKNVYGNESIPARYSFIIDPPWYRSVISIIIYVVLAIFLFWLFARLYSYRLKRENIRLEGIVTERTAEVVRQKDEIITKNIELEYQKKEIEDSIRYARRIQSAVIPSEKDCVNLLTESFVFFKPLNIVSGDFYWISKAGSKIIFTAADCTGHGVPGAFMSMLGVAFLNEIVNKDNVTAPDMILNQLRDKVIQALQQQGISGEACDGMDIALVSIDSESNKLEFAGAYNPLIMIRNGEIFETSSDKMPIAIYERMRAFRKHEIILEKGDVFYMYSDGYEDQFGGPEGKKFLSKRLKQLLLEIHNYPMKMQKEILEKNFKEWKGDLPQIDDVVVVGFAIDR